MKGVQGRVSDAGAVADDGEKLCIWRRWIVHQLICATLSFCKPCSPVSCVHGRRALLRSSVSGQLLVPRATTATRQLAHFPLLTPPRGHPSPA